MIRYLCDWCEREFPLNGISSVRVGNVYSKPARVHICRACARVHMPARLQPLLSWTAEAGR